LVMEHRNGLPAACLTVMPARSNKRFLNAGTGAQS
jgi:hypothetical protein